MQYKHYNRLCQIKRDVKGGSGFVEIREHFVCDLCEETAMLYGEFYTRYNFTRRKMGRGKKTTSATPGIYFCTNMGEQAISTPGILLDRP